MTAECLRINTKRTMIRTSSAAIEHDEWPQRVAIKVIRCVQETLIDLGNEGQLVEVLDGGPRRIAENLSRATAPHQTLDRGKLRSTRLCRKPVPHGVLIFPHGDRLQRDRHRKRFSG